LCTSFTETIGCSGVQLFVVMSISYNLTEYRSSSFNVQRAIG